MSSRGELIGSGPSAGLYQPRPVPAESKDIQTYINDELLQLGGRLNEVFEGGAFPPQASMPVRWREGMMIFFTELPDDIYHVGEDAGKKIITSTGVWLYKDAKWWKIIDDPTSIVGGLTFYCLQADTSTPPTTPETGPNLPPVSPGFTWEEIPPEKPDKGYYIYSTTLVQFVEEDGDYYWSDPTIWSGGVVDGNDGPVGPPGDDGTRVENWFIDEAGQPDAPDDYPPTAPGWRPDVPNPILTTLWTSFVRLDSSDNIVGSWSFPAKVTGDDGEDGDDGAEGVRGTISVSGEEFAGGTDEEFFAAAWDAIVRETIGENPNQPIPWDSVVFVHPTPAEGNYQTRSLRFVSGPVSPGIWSDVAVVIDGDAIVTGTINGDKIIADTIQGDKIVAGTVNADRIDANTNLRVGATTAQSVILHATDTNSRIWVGDNDEAATANFRVAPNGDMFANNGYFGGNVEVEGLQGVVGTDSSLANTSPIFSVAYNGSVQRRACLLSLKKEPFPRKALVKIYCHEAQFGGISGLTGNEYAAVCDTLSTVNSTATGSSHLLRIGSGTHTLPSGVTLTDTGGLLYFRWIGYNSNGNSRAQVYGDLNYFLDIGAMVDDGTPLSITLNALLTAPTGVWPGSGTAGSMSVSTNRWHADVSVVKSQEAADINITAG